MCAKIISHIFLTLSFILVGVQAIGQKWYYVSSTHETWSDALSNCESIGMKLLEIDTLEKSQQLQEYFKRRTYGTSTVNGFQLINYWTAGNLRNDMNRWMWRASEKAISFTSWARGQPDNTNESADEHCIELFYFTNTELLWKDSNCLIMKQFICETP